MFSDHLQAITGPYWEIAALNKLPPFVFAKAPFGGWYLLVVSLALIFMHSVSIVTSFAIHTLPGTHPNVSHLVSLKCTLIGGHPLDLIFLIIDLILVLRFKNKTYSKDGAKTSENYFTMRERERERVLQYTKIWKGWRYYNLK